MVVEEPAPLDEEKKQPAPLDEEKKQPAPTPKELDEFLQSEAFQRFYIYNTDAIKDMLQAAKSLSVAKRAVFMAESSTCDPTTLALLGEQDEKYGHSGCSAGMTAHFTRRILCDFASLKAEVFADRYGKHPLT